MKKTPIKVAFIQPIVGPVREAWFRKLAGRTELSFCVFSLSEKLDHRPGWRTRTDAGFPVQQLRSLVIPSPRYFAGNRRGDVARRLVPINLAWALYRYRPDVVVATNATELLQALPVKWLFGSKLVLLAEDTPLTVSRIGAIRRRFKTSLYKLADAYAAHSSEARRLLVSLGIGDNRIGFTPWAVEIDKFAQSDESGSATPRPSDSKLEMITIGALIPRKGIDRLLHAWAQLPPELSSEARLSVLGTGPEYEHLTELANTKGLDNIEFAGHLDHSQVADRLKHAELFVFPTLEDIWGFVVSEAMAAALPILCSRYAGCASDLVSEDVNGWIFDPLDIAGFTAGLEHAIRHRTALADMGKASKQIVARFTIDRSVDNLVKLLKHTAASGSTTASRPA